MNEVELKIQELREQYKTETDPQKRKVIEQMDDGYRCCASVGEKGNVKRCENLVRSLKAVTCEAHTQRVEYNGDGIDKPKRVLTVIEIQDRLKKMGEEEKQKNRKTLFD